MKGGRILGARDSMSATVRVLEVTRRYFRDAGASPSYREIAALAGVSVGRVRGHLNKLQAEGFLQHVAHQPRSIVMTDRTANLSDAELELGCHGRHWTIVKPPPVLAALADIYPADTRGTDLPADWADLLGQIDPAAVPAVPGSGEDVQSEEAAADGGRSESCGGATRK